jgi:DNA replication protein DnaC
VTTAIFEDAQHERLAELCVRFKLPTVGRELCPRLVQAGCDAALATVLEVLEMEAQDRSERRVERLLRAADLPPGKTLATLNEGRFPKPLLAKVRELAKGGFLERGDNVLCFGLPGVGKTHVAAAIGHELVQRGHSVLFAPTYVVVQELLAAKRDLELPRALRRYDAYEVVILDDLGYVQQSVDEAEVLFTLLAERYERRSVVVTSNLVFSEWGRIFKNPMTTAAAVDRLVHHATILDFGLMKTFRAPEGSDDNYGADDNYTAAPGVVVVADGDGPAAVASDPTKPITSGDKRRAASPTKKLAALGCVSRRGTKPKTKFHSPPIFHPTKSNLPGEDRQE